MDFDFRSLYLEMLGFPEPAALELPILFAFYIFIDDLHVFQITSS